MPINIKRDIKNVLSRTFLNKDRDAFKALLLQHARIFFSDKIKDFSEVSVGGMLLDFPAEIGDHMSFYLDHQFTELDSELAIESQNIQRHLRRAGVPITGASPAVVAVAWAIEVPAELVGASYVPQESALPVILQGSIVESEEGILFELTEDLDFSRRYSDGTLKAKITIGSTSSAGNPLTYILVLGGSGNFPAAPDGICLSGFRALETFQISNTYIPFREITLAQENVTQVVSVTDSDGNVYYEVESLAQDTVFKGIPNLNSDNDLVNENLEVIPAPYRYTRTMDFDTKLTTLRFGSGNASTLNDDIIPDPSDLALPLYGRQTFSRFTLDPGQLLGTQTLGIAPLNTSISVDYRYGGGLRHNVAAKSINTLSTLRMSFPGNISSTLAQQIRASVSIRNVEPATGGEDALTLDELRSRIPAARNAQSRIVTASDLLARVYTMPSNFGRVFRAGIRSNPRNPLATQLFIISRDADGKLIISPDSLKKNLRIFLNEFRMISDAIDILDAAIINLCIEFKIAVEPNSVKNIILQDIMARLRKYFEIKNFQIDQPIRFDDIHSIIYSAPGVASVIDLRFKNITGNVVDRQYSDVKFDTASNTRKRLLIPNPPGSIFEIRYPEFDIVGSAV
jgi:hypothetical protein